MSVVDEAKELQERILTRLSALEPARREYDELIEAAKVLKLNYKPNGSTTRRAAASRTTRSKRAQGKPTRTRGRKRADERKIAPPGERRGQVLKAVTEKPGVTIAEVAAQLGLPDGTSLYRVQRQLVKEKVIRKEGAAMYPAS